MASAPQSQAFGERFPPAPRSGPGWARGAAPRWVPAAGTAAPAPREGGGRGGGGAGEVEDTGRDFARHDSRRRVGEREGLEQERGVESGGLGNKESKEGE